MNQPRLGPRARRLALEGYAFIAPSLLTIGAVVALPLAYVVWASLSRWTYGRPTGFAGLANYLTVLRDPLFYATSRNTLVFTAGSTAFEFVLGLGMASLLNHSGRAEGFARTVLILPYMVSMVAGSVAFKWMLNSEFGIVNHVLMRLRLLRSPVNWLGDPRLAMLSVILVSAWQASPFVAVILLAGMKGISRELYEAAQIDGAGGMQCFRAITLPLLRPQIAVVLLIRTMFSLRNFDIPFSLTGGGPGITTKFWAILLQEKMIHLGFGYNAALSVIMIVITLVICSGYVRIARQRPGEERW